MWRRLRYSGPVNKFKLFCTLLFPGNARKALRSDGGGACNDRGGAAEGPEANDGPPPSTSSVVEAWSSPEESSGDKRGVERRALNNKPPCIDNCAVLKKYPTLTAEKCSMLQKSRPATAALQTAAAARLAETTTEG